MTKDQISNYLRKLTDIVLHKELPNFVGISSKDYSYIWLINNNIYTECDLTIPIKNIDEAVELIHAFSDEPKNFIKLNLNSQEYIEEQKLYLHFSKQFKLPK
ncbi:hypothetical protein D1J36_004120 [Riemerella anatipestifer]|uniref:hypothetical protein n=1 Tax=Riemerella anatipestifer TaxID=34085 RepID=UPI0012AE6C06|nr:hypothetical protein [Riemerella anatipestifer]USL96296.1 hypothetical protein D1J36_004120 [Riemerella anatipestifer]